MLPRARQKAGWHRQQATFPAAMRSLPGCSSAALVVRGQYISISGSRCSSVYVSILRWRSVFETAEDITWSASYPARPRNPEQCPVSPSCSWLDAEGLCRRGAVQIRVCRSPELCYSIVAKGTAERVAGPAQSQAPKCGGKAHSHSLAQAELPMLVTQGELAHDIWNSACHSGKPGQPASGHTTRRVVPRLRGSTLC